MVFPTHSALAPLSPVVVSLFTTTVSLSLGRMPKFMKIMTTRWRPVLSVLLPYVPPEMLKGGTCFTVWIPAVFWLAITGLNYLCPPMWWPVSMPWLVAIREGWNLATVTLFRLSSIPITMMTMTTILHLSQQMMFPQEWMPLKIQTMIIQTMITMTAITMIISMETTIITITISTYSTMVMIWTSVWYQMKLMMHMTKSLWYPTTTNQSLSLSKKPMTTFRIHHPTTTTTTTTTTTMGQWTTTTLKRSPNLQLRNEWTICTVPGSVATTSDHGNHVTTDTSIPHSNTLHSRNTQSKRVCKYLVKQESMQCWKNLNSFMIGK